MHSAPGQSLLVHSLCWHVPAESLDDGTSELAIVQRNRAGQISLRPASLVNKAVNVLDSSDDSEDGLRSTPANKASLTTSTAGPDEFGEYQDAVSSVDKSEPEDDGVQPLDAPDTVDEPPLLMEQGSANFELAGKLHQMLYIHQVCTAARRIHEHKLTLASPAVPLQRAMALMVVIVTLSVPGGRSDEPQPLSPLRGAGGGHQVDVEHLESEQRRHSCRRHGPW